MCFVIIKLFIPFHYFLLYQHINLLHKILIPSPFFLQTLYYYLQSLTFIKISFHLFFKFLILSGIHFFPNLVYLLIIFQCLLFQLHIQLIFHTFQLYLIYNFFLILILLTFRILFHPLLQIKLYFLFLPRSWIIIRCSLSDITKIIFLNAIEIAVLATLHQPLLLAIQRTSQHTI